MRDWDSHFMRRAWLNSTMSTCMTRQVGAVAVRDRRAFADGFNGNLPGEQHCNEGGCPRCAEAVSGIGLGRCLCVHAEENIVTYCARTGTPMNNSVVYSTTKPCLGCTKLLYSAGVVEIVFDDDYNDADGTLILPNMIIRQVTAK